MWKKKNRNKEDTWEKIKAQFSADFVVYIIG